MRRSIGNCGKVLSRLLEWTGQQIVEAFCEGKVPRFLISRSEWSVCGVGKRCAGASFCPAA
jgi:hypothetical protein